MVQGYLGVDVGTQGLSVIFTDGDMRLVASGSAPYDMVKGLGDACYEQAPADWEAALRAAMDALRQQIGPHPWEVLAIGISGQMHGEVVAAKNGAVLGTARLWCDGRNAAESTELTERLRIKMPKRLTAVRWLATCRQDAARRAQAAQLTTPAGWLSHRLTGAWTLGVGDAAGMFPIDPTTLDYDRVRLAEFDRIVADDSAPRLADLLPTVRCAGQDGGQLNASAAEWLGLTAGIPVAPAEGDQPAALAGSLIGRAGMVSMSFGTSVCANFIGDRPFQGIDPAVDHFCAADGKPINMVCLRNGTTFMNAMVKMFDGLDGASDPFAIVIPRLLAVEPECGGLLALPFMDDEPGLGVSRGGTGILVGLNGLTASAGHVAKAALLATIFNLRLGCESLDRQGYPRSEIILTGGLTKTPELAQIIADCFATDVTVLASAQEGTAWGAALLAKYRYAQSLGQAEDWTSFLERQSAGERRVFRPRETLVGRYAQVYRRYLRLMRMHGQLASCLDA